MEVAGRDGGDRAKRLRQEGVVHSMILRTRHALVKKGKALGEATQHRAVCPRYATALASTYHELTRSNQARDTSRCHYSDLTLSQTPFPSLPAHRYHARKSVLPSRTPPTHRHNKVTHRRSGLPISRRKSLCRAVLPRKGAGNAMLWTLPLDPGKPGRGAKSMCRGGSGTF